MHPFSCGHCQRPVFFENDRCNTCGAALGYAPAVGDMLAFDGAAMLAPPGGEPWARSNPNAGPPLQPCANRHSAAACNWMLDDGDVQALCRSCRLTRLLPALDNPRNQPRRRTIEQAKRRLMFTLIGLGLGPEPKQGPDDALGLEFLLLENTAGSPPVSTGHAGGTITLDVAEADDDWRESVRLQFGEPMRTLLGHLRHEAAHYLQYRWVTGTPAAELCRTTFGDERSDYTQALQRHHAEGPPPNWPQHFVSAYASAHPWEDWAETCAHYLLVIDAVQTAGAWGLQLSGPAPAAPAALNLADAPPVPLLVLQQWLPVAQFLNAMHRSLGRHDSYPFLLPEPVLNKMAVVQQLLQQASAQRPA